MELRILKDFEVNSKSWAGAMANVGRKYTIDIDELKQEAIKWIKCFDSDEYFETMDNTWSTGDPREVSGFLKYFFDINEADLK